MDSQEGSSLEGEYSSVRANPGNVAEAKEMYKQFHQKAAKNVQKKKVDFGDTWVGLGKVFGLLATVRVKKLAMKLKNTFTILGLMRKQGSNSRN